MAELEDMSFRESDVLIALLIVTSRLYDVLMAGLPAETRMNLQAVHAAGGLLGPEPILNPEEVKKARGEDENQTD